MFSSRLFPRKDINKNHSIPGNAIPANLNSGRKPHHKRGPHRPHSRLIGAAGL
jgi:hypothetical protein